MHWRRRLHLSPSWKRTLWLAQALSIPLLLVLVILMVHRQALAHAPAPAVVQSDLAPVQVLHLALPGVTPTVDPALVADQQGYLISSLLYSGLVRLVYQPAAPLANRYTVVPALARRWTISPDHRTYTFYLRSGVRFSNTKHDWLTAADVVYSLKRSLNPQLNSPAAATYLSDIVGATRYLEGRSRTIAGIRALNAHTVQITVRWPVPYFLMELAYPTAFIVDRHQIQRYGAQGWYAHLAGTGPFRVKSWTPGVGMVLVRNRYYPGPRPKLSEIDISFTPVSSAIHAFKSGAADIIAVPMRGWTEAAKLKGFELTTALAIYGVYENYRVKPFNNHTVREAFALATNRSTLIRSTFGWRAVPFAGYIPFGEAGYDPSLRVAPYEPARARWLWHRYWSRLHRKHKPVPAITLAYANEPDQARLAKALVKMWRRVLHVKIALQALMPNVLQTSIQSGSLQLYLSDWFADYPDPHDWLSVPWKTGQPENTVHFTDARFDALMDAADETWAPSVRTQLDDRAQQRLVSENAWLPLYIPERAALVRETVHGVELTGYGLLPSGGDWANVYLTRSHTAIKLGRLSHSW
jgi:oligopeptide transport system substrate-binding protein